MRILITAGPTREYIDPVRYLSNESSGKMGFALAAAARRRGHEVILIAGPVCLPTPKGVERIDVISARDMLKVLRDQFETADALVMAAAVADFRPRRRLRGKWKAKEGSGELHIELLENPDLLKSVARRKGERKVVAFALETSEGKRRARAKMVAKNADFIVLNGVSALGGDRISVTLLDREGNEFELLQRTKAEVARVLIKLLE
jgi:phosphopantothenoylcysteine decarboxylase/phosphopantothenate--cysteine ligase